MATTVSQSFALTENERPGGTFDMSNGDIYHQDRWQAPFKHLRETDPIHWTQNGQFGDFWNVTDYKSVQHIESLPEIFSSSFEYGGITLADRDENDSTELVMPMFIAMDRPKHTGQRRTVAPAFTPSEMRRMSDDIRRRTAEVLDELPYGETFDWVDRVSIELTTQMLALLFDFPWADRRKLTEWSDWAGDIELAMDASRREERLGHLYEMAAYFHKIWNEKLDKEPSPDLISMMIHSDAMREMDEAEFMGNLILLIVGGNDTTRNTMSGIAYGLHKFPEQREKLEQNPDLIPNAVQEFIRWQTPLAHMRRTATEDYDLGGKAIKKGDKLALWYISANRDESVFEDPDSIMIDRPNARRHLAFGYGIHRCVGARLAELQIAILLEEMAKRRMRVNVLAEPERVKACFVHGYRSMTVELTKY